VERLRGELNQRDNEIESLKSSLLKSVTEAECTKGRLREVEYENIDPETQELREKMLVSLKNNKEALEQANDETDQLNQRLTRETSADRSLPG